MRAERSLFVDEATWIGSSHPFDLHEAYLCFRSPDSWRLQDRPQQAELLLTADSRYKLWINGRFVARGPARSFPSAQAVDRLDVTSYMRPGRNVLAVHVYQPGYSHFAYLHRGAAGLLAELRCDGQATLVTGSDWRVRRDPSFAAGVRRISIYGSGVEERDLRQADDWVDLSYDDSAWDPARIVASVGSHPWTGLRERSLPLLEEWELPLPLPDVRCGPYPAGRRHDPHLALREGWATAVTAEMEADADDWFCPALQEDEAAYWLFDLGRDYTCQGWVEVKGAGGEERLSISYAEKIRDGDLVLSDPQTYCRVRMTDRFRLRPGGQEAEPFALRGGRYLIFQLSGPAGPGLRLRFHARASRYPLQVTHEVATEDPLLAEVITLCERTFEACLQDGFIDCTWREAAQWVGDALPQSLIMASMSDDTRPLRQVIGMAAEGTYEDGVLPSVLPGEVHAYVVVDYNFTWVELLDLYSTLSGDDDFVAEMWPVLSKMLDRFHRDVGHDGLILSQPGRRLFLDWAPLSRQEPNAVYNLHYLLALQTAAGLAERLDTGTGDAATWQRRASALQFAIRRAFWHEGRWYDDGERTTHSQLSAALALITRTVRDGEKEVLLQALVDRSLDPHDEHTPGEMVLNSPFMHHYIFEALRQEGREEAVVEIVRRRWGRWVRDGYPTTWENWDVDFPDGSQCHAFSAHPRYHLAQIARANAGALGGSS